MKEKTSQKEFPSDIAGLSQQVPGKYPASTPQAPHKHPTSTRQAVQILNKALYEPKSRGELQETLGLKDREHFRKTYLEPLIAEGLLELTIPDKPRSPKQKYRTTTKGRAFTEITSRYGQ